MSAFFLLLFATSIGASPQLEVLTVPMWGVFAQSDHDQTQVPRGSVAMRFVAEGEALILNDMIDFSDAMDTAGLPAFHGQMSASDAALFAEFTGRHVMENVRFIACGVTIMEATVQTRMHGGRFFVIGLDANEMLADFLENGCP